MTAPAFSLLHGFLGAPGFWNPIVDTLKIAFPKAIFHTPWLPGHAPPTDSEATVEVPPTFNDAITWYTSQIRAIAPCWTIGYSMGARLSLGAALQYSNLFSGAILISMHPGIAKDGERKHRAEWEVTLKSMLRNDGPDKAMSALVDYFETLPIFATQKALPEQILTKQRQMRLSHDPHRIASSIVSLGLASSPDMATRLQHNSLPVHIITGMQDIKYTDIGAELAGTHDFVTHSAIANVGHNTVLEAPKETSEIIASFVRKNTFR